MFETLLWKVDSEHVVKATLCDLINNLFFTPLFYSTTTLRG